MSGIESEISYGGDGVDVEVVTSDGAPAEKVDVETGLDNYIAQRKAEHPEWFNETTESPFETVETLQEEAAEEAAETAETRKTKEPLPAEMEREEAPEPESVALKRVLARERKLRESQKSFEERAADFERKFQAYEEAQRLAKLDPVSYLKAAGVSEEDLIDIAKSLYYESLGELAPDDYKGQKETVALKRELEALKQKLEAKNDPQIDPAQEAVMAYQQELLDTAKSFDEVQYPTVAKVVDAYSEADVAADMFRVAQMYAEERGGNGRPLSPSECLERVEVQYAKLFGNQKQEVNKPAPVKKTPAVKKTLSNSMSKSQPPSEPVSKDMSYDEIKRIARSNFFSKLSE